MKLTTYVLRFSDLDSEEVQINVDRFGLFSAKLPLRIVNTLGAPKEPGERSLNELRRRLDDYVQKYLDYQSPPKKVVVYAFGHRNPFGDFGTSKDKYVTRSTVGVAWSHAILKADDIYLCDETFNEVEKYREDRGRTTWHVIDYSPEVVESFKKISAGIIELHKLLRDTINNGFVNDFSKMLNVGVVEVIETKGE
jgi:hypothetical protein